MSSPTLAASATAAAILLAAVGVAAPRDDGARSVRSLAHEEEQLPRVVPTERLLFAAAPGGEPFRKRGAGTGAHYPALTDSPKMKG